MWRERIERYILPGHIENDPGFQKEIQRLSHIGLRVMGGVEIAFRGVHGHVMYSWAGMSNPSHADRYAGNDIGIGALTSASARVKALYRHARFIASLSALIVAVVLTGSMLLMMQYDPNADDAIPVNITLIMLVGAAAIPFRPTDMLLFGFLRGRPVCAAGRGRQADF